MRPPRTCNIAIRATSSTPPIAFPMTDGTTNPLSISPQPAPPEAAQ